MADSQYQGPAETRKKSRTFHEHSMTFTVSQGPNERQALSHEKLSYKTGTVWRAMSVEIFLLI